MGERTDKTSSFSSVNKKPASCELNIASRVWLVKPFVVCCAFVNMKKYQRILFTFFVTTLCLQRIESATPLVTTDTITDPEIFKLSPSWLTIFDCFREDSPTSCLQKRAFRAIEEAMPSSETDQADNYVSQEKGEKGKSKEKFPEGVSPAMGRFIERLGDIIATGITHFYPDDVPEIGENSTSQSIQAGIHD